MSEPTTAAAGSAYPPVLEYGLRDRIGDTRRRLRAWLLERLYGAGRFIGVFVALAGGWRQTAFALGLGATLGGLGHCLTYHGSDGGVWWMFIGGVAIGLSIRAPRK